MCEKEKPLPMLPALRYGAFGILIGCVIVLSFSFAFMFEYPSVFLPFTQVRNFYFGESSEITSVDWMGTEVHITVENQKVITANAFSFSYARSLRGISRVFFGEHGKLLELDYKDYSRYENFISDKQDVADMSGATVSSHVN